VGAASEHANPSQNTIGPRLRRNAPRLFKPCGDGPVARVAQRHANHFPGVFGATAGFVGDAVGALAAAGGLVNAVYSPWSA
jgi:hypothetical protein